MRQCTCILVIHKYLLHPRTTAAVTISIPEWTAWQRAKCIAPILWAQFEACRWNMRWKLLLVHELSPLFKLYGNRAGHRIPHRSVSRMAKWLQYSNPPRMQWHTHCTMTYRGFPPKAVPFDTKRLALNKHARGCIHSFISFSTNKEQTLGKCKVSPIL